MELVKLNGTYFRKDTRPAQICKSDTAMRYRLVVSFSVFSKSASQGSGFKPHRWAFPLPARAIEREQQFNLQLILIHHLVLRL